MSIAQRLIFGYGGGTPTPTDPYWSSVEALLHFEGADGGTTFTDQSGKVWTATASATTSTAQMKFGSSSGLFDGTTGEIHTPHSADFNLVTGDFTIEAFVRPTTLGAVNYVIQKDGVSGSSFSQWAIGIGSGQPNFGWGTGNGVGGFQSITATSTLLTGAWYHIAATRQGTTMRIFVDGVLENSLTQTQTMIDGGKQVMVGYAPGSAAAQHFAGNIDELRITKGVARYTASFTPPAMAFPNS